jgi:glycosyltransferase involved in cell wall biosynthesis
MRILHIIPTYLPAIGSRGAIDAVHNLNKWLVKDGINVVVYTLNRDGLNILNVPTGQPVYIDGVKVYYFKSSFPKFWHYSKDLKITLRKNISNFDVVHITSVYLAASCIGAYYARKFKKPYIISPHGSFMARPLKSKSFKKKLYLFVIERRNLAAASAIHFATDREFDEYIRMNLPLRKPLIIPHSFDPSVYNIKAQKNFHEILKISKNKKIILFLGRLNWIKGLDTLIPAFAEVIKHCNDVVLVLAGENDGYKNQLFRLINKYNLFEKVLLPGVVINEDKISALRDSAVFVMPSYSENFCMAIVEAMYFGLPVIITKGVGIAPNVEKAQAGLVIEKNEKQLSEAILKILNNQDSAKKMGERGRELVKREFFPERIANTFIKAYNEIINE